MNYRWYKKELEFLRTLSQGTMPITKVCKDDDEWDSLTKDQQGDWIEYWSEDE